MKTLSLTAMFMTAVFLAYLRISGEKSQLFQAVAHLFVGGLIAYAIATKSFRWCGVTALLISLVELGVFIHDKTK